MYEITTEIPYRWPNRLKFTTFVVPDRVTKICREAFWYCTNLRKIYIPKSVTEIEKDAFVGCLNLEIYCEDEPKEGWVYGMRKGIERYEIVTPEDDAFNFHRSGGSFSSTTVEREMETFHDWNSNKRPVFTHVPRDVTKDWEK